MAYGGPLFLRRGGPYVPLYDAGLVRFGKPQAAGDPGKMSIHDDGGNTEKGGKHYPGGFPSHSRKRRKLFHGVRDTAPMAVPKLPGKGLDIPGLGPEEPGGMDQLFKFREGGFRKGRRIGKPGKEGWGGKVHRRVRTLGGKDCGNQKLEGVCIIQKGPVIRVQGAEGSHYSGKTNFCFLKFGNRHAASLP
jgi:hypothetical protein